MPEPAPNRLTILGLAAAAVVAVVVVPEVVALVVELTDEVAMMVYTER